MRSYCRIVNFDSWYWEIALPEKLREFFSILNERKEIINVSSFTKMRADWVYKKKLNVNISLNKIDSWLRFTTVH